MADVCRHRQGRRVINISLIAGYVLNPDGFFLKYVIRIYLLFQFRYPRRVREDYRHFSEENARRWGVVEEGAFGSEGVLLALLAST